MANTPLLIIAALGLGACCITGMMAQACLPHPSHKQAPSSNNLALSKDKS